MKKLLTATAMLALLSGCASILNEKTQQVNVSTSNGQQVSGTVNGQSFTAPGVVALIRENKNKVFVTNTDNCKSETAVEKTVDPIFFINLFVGGLVGSSTDFASEKMWKYSENVTLNCR